MGSFHNPFDNGVDEDRFEEFKRTHEARLRSLSIPECKWKVLCQKLYLSIFDAGDNFMYASEAPLEEDDEFESKLRVYTKCEMSHEDSEHIYLIDHAWTYTLETAKKALEANTSLTERMATIMDVSFGEPFSRDEVIKSILSRMWQYNNFYTIQLENEPSAIKCWYVMDDFGCKIGFSDEPSFEIVPFFFAADHSSYSLLYPKSYIAEGEEVTVSYPGCDRSMPEGLKSAIKYPWIHSDLSDIDFNLEEPSVEYFASGRLEDTLPENYSNLDELEKLMQKQLTVYSDYSDVNEFLTHPSFQVVSEKEQANILWLSARVYNIKELVGMHTKFCFISQFPSEQVLINKDLLAVVCRRHEEKAFDFETLESYPEWLPTTFNLKTELPKFVSYFLHRKKKKLDNVWICKPFNLARGMDICVTDNIAQIIRISETRPMVACKYITDPVLFPSEGKGLVKMDLRYIVLLCNTDPLELYVYDRFWIRFSNKPFVLEDFNDYETHFTVMNYVDFPLQQMFCHNFIREFEDHYTSYKWSDIQEKINKMIKDIFVAAILKGPPAGLAKFSGSRAVYGLDIMLRWDRNHDIPKMEPMILEVNWMPDCKRACQYYPEFYNDVFSVLFLGDTKDKHVVKL